MIEGEGEHFLDDKGFDTKRFMSCFKKDELEIHLKEQFKILDSQITHSKTRTFVHVFCKKK